MVNNHNILLGIALICDHHDYLVFGVLGSERMAHSFKCKLSLVLLFDYDLFIGLLVRRFGFPIPTKEIFTT